MSNSYYLVESGPVKEKALEYIDLLKKNTRKIREMVISVGGTGYQTGFDGRLFGILFPPGIQLSKEWKKPKNGASFPKRGTNTFNSLRSVSLPKSTDIVNPVLNCPLGLSWSNEGGHGSMCLGDLNPIKVLWLDDIIAIVTPDVNRAIQDLKDENGEGVTVSVDKWEPPEGLVEISEKRWDFMVAQYDLEQEEMSNEPDNG